MTKIAFLGLGVMGFPMAGYLASNNDNQVTVYNRTTSKAEDWLAKYRGNLEKTPSKASRNADFVCLCVGDDNDVRKIITGDNGVLETLSAGSTIIDHTTTSATLAQEIFTECEKRNIAFIDAPVSGGQAGAENGQLTIMCGGTPHAYQSATKILDHYAKFHSYIGTSGMGQTAKMMNQICIAGLLQGLSEAIHFGKKAEIEIAKVISAISKGAAQSWQMENRWQTMTDDEFNFGFAVDWMRKDLGICLDEARKNGAQLPVTALVDQFYAELQQQGASRLDTSCLIKRLKN